MNWIYKNVYYLIICFLVGSDCIVLAQCIPPSSDSCRGASIICSLSDLNGYCCRNLDYRNLSGCIPLCPMGGGTHNTQWWAFVTQGGKVDIGINFSNCSVNGSGVQLGIWGDCSCQESIVCNPACNGPGTYMISVNLQPCKIYYLFVDGCNGDVCDFCLTTSGGDRPKLPPLGSIVGMKELCVGARDIKYSIENIGPCTATYEWSLDGIKVGNESGELLLNFIDVGDFTLCVTSCIGYPCSNESCSREGPSCIRISVRNNLDVIITPNGDGYNDYFQIDCPKIDLNDIYIYDKWGTCVYSEINFTNLWHGIDLSGNLLPSGVYVYRLIGKNSDIILKGTITIIR